MRTDTELTEIIKRGESDRVEFTASEKDIDKVSKAICAFANDLPNYEECGFVFIGIKDDGSCANLTIDDGLLTKLGGLRSDGKILPFPTMAVDKRNLNGCEVAVIQVEPSDNPPIKVSGRCWIRTGPSRAQATAEEERRLTEKRRWGNIPYDMHEVTGSTIEDDLNMRRFELEYLPNAVSPEVLEENDRNRKDQLRSLRLVTQDDTPTVTAVLMLGKIPSNWLPGAYIQFIRFAGEEFDAGQIKDNKEMHGTLPDQLEKLDEILEANISSALDMRDRKHIQQPDYPFVALREITRNAVIHRNYDGSNTPVRIHWFSDRVEIISPSSVYGRVTQENFGEPGVTDYRNPTIAEAMKNMGYMEKFGSGIDTTKRTLCENGNPDIKFEFKENFILAVIRRRQ